MKKILSITITAIFFLVLCSGYSFALSAKSLFNGDPDSITYLEDSDVEWEVNQSGNTEGILEEGDYLKGAFSIENIDGQGIGDATSYTGISGTYEIKVLSKTDTGNNLQGFNLYSYEFGPTGSTGSVVSMWENTDPITSFSGKSKTEIISRAETGNLLYEFGFTGNTDEYWMSPSIPDNIGSLDTLGVLPDTSIGTYEFELGTITNNFLPLRELSDTYANGEGIDIRGSGDLFAPDDGEVYDAESNIRVRMNTVPEPTTLLLLGTGLLGLAGLSRKKFFKKS